VNCHEHLTRHTVHVCQQVVDCRICGHPASGDGLRFGFVELQHEG
jgi:hypothetical protein